eukprot:738711_1
MLQSKNMQNRCIPIELNIRKTTSIKQFLQILSDKHNISNIDMLINNAGGQYPSVMHNTSEKGWKAVIDLNLTGTFLMSKSVFNHFWENRDKNDNNEKVIINITAASFTGMPTMPHSSAARAGVENLTITMQQTWSKYGIRVNSVAPGMILSSGIDTYSKEYHDKYIKGAEKNFYAYRGGEVEEVSNVVLFLLSPGGSYIMGACIRVDGGLTIYNTGMLPEKPLWNIKADISSKL